MTQDLLNLLKNFDQRITKLTEIIDLVNSRIDTTNKLIEVFESKIKLLEDQLGDGGESMH